MISGEDTVAEAGLAARFACVGLIGFALDAALLRGGLALGLSPAVARLVSLVLAMQVTFTINRLHVFRAASHKSTFRQWCAYMATNGFGNVCNYWIFVTLSSLHGQAVSKWFVALPISAGSAYLINYAGVRLVVFRKLRLARRPATPQA
jgi:putative flippase GtrA